MKTYTLTEQKADEFFRWLVDRVSDQMFELTKESYIDGDGHSKEEGYYLDDSEKAKVIEWVKDAFYEMCLKNGGVNE